MPNYKEIYEDLYSKDYPAGPAKKVWQWACDKIKWQSRRVVDVGCGKAVLKTIINREAEYLGLDVASVQLPEGCFEHNVVETSILATFGDFDIATCFDVLEHIAEDDLDKMIRHIVCASELQVFSISCRKAHYEDLHGDNLHVTVKPASWWKERLAKQTTILLTEEHGSDLYVIAGNAKYLLDEPTCPSVPYTVFGQRVREYPDNTFGIGRNNREAVAYLDHRFRRAGKLRWERPMIEGSTLDSMGIGGKVAIVGKGPSLDTISIAELKVYDTVIFVNDSWKRFHGHLDNMIICQIDTGFGHENAVAPMIVSQVNAAEFRDIPHAVHTRSTFKDGKISAAVAINTAKEAGAKSIDLYAFDAVTKGNVDYANSIGYNATKGGDPARFYRHKSMILKALGDLPHTFH
jgi:hypothetical protein